MKALCSVMMAGLLLFAAPNLRADTCDDIHNLSARWDKLATYIDNHSDDGKLRKSEVRKVVADLNVLIPPTAALGKVLISDFKGKDEKRVHSLGLQMVAALEEFSGLKEDDDDWDDVVTIFSRLVEVIDKVADECEK